MPRQKQRFKIQAVIERDGDGFHGYCPALRGLHTCGETPELAKQHLADAVLAYLTSLKKHGDPIPVGEEVTCIVSRPRRPAVQAQEIQVSL